jgi:hypothetical protein
MLLWKRGRHASVLRHAIYEGIELAMFNNDTLPLAQLSYLKSVATVPYANHSRAERPANDLPFHKTLSPAPRHVRTAAALLLHSARPLATNVSFGKDGQISNTLSGPDEVDSLEK